MEPTGCRTARPTQATVRKALTGETTELDPLAWGIDGTVGEEQSVGTRHRCSWCSDKPITSYQSETIPLCEGQERCCIILRLNRLEPEPTIVSLPSSNQHACSVERHIQPADRRTTYIGSPEEQLILTPVQSQTCRRNEQHQIGPRSLSRDDAQVVGPRSEWRCIIEPYWQCKAFHQVTDWTRSHLPLTDEGLAIAFGVEVEPGISTQFEGTEEGSLIETIETQFKL